MLQVDHSCETHCSHGHVECRHPVDAIAQCRHLHGELKISLAFHLLDVQNSLFYHQILLSLSDSVNGGIHDSHFRITIFFWRHYGLTRFALHYNKHDFVENMNERSRLVEQNEFHVQRELESQTVKRAQTLSPNRTLRVSTSHGNVLCKMKEYHKNRGMDKSPSLKNILRIRIPELRRVAPNKKTTTQGKHKKTKHNGLSLIAHPHSSLEYGDDDKYLTAQLSVTPPISRRKEEGGDKRAGQQRPSRQDGSTNNDDNSMDEEEFQQTLRKSARTVKEQIQLLRTKMSECNTKSSPQYKSLSQEHKRLKLKIRQMKNLVTKDSRQESEKNNRDLESFSVTERLKELKRHERVSPLIKKITSQDPEKTVDSSAIEELNQRKRFVREINDEVANLELRLADIQNRCEENEKQQKELEEIHIASLFTKYIQNNTKRTENLTNLITEYQLELNTLQEKLPCCQDENMREIYRKRIILCEVLFLARQLYNTDIICLEITS